MSEGVKALRKIQIAQETTAGTILAATSYWRGMGVLDDQRETVIPDEDIGILGGVDRAYTPKLLAAISFESVEATFEQVAHIWEAGLKDATPSQDGTGTGYISEYPISTTAANDIKTYTIEGGDNQQAEVMEYGIVTDFTMEGVAGEAWKISAEWLGRQVADQAFTADVSIPAVEEILFSKTQLRLGTSGTAFASLPLMSKALIGATLEVKTGVMPYFTAEGNLYFTAHKITKPEITLKLTFEHTAGAVVEKNLWRNNTTRLIRLQATGSVFTTAGTTYPNKTMILDFAGKWTKFNPLGDQDGNDIVEAEFKALYSSADAMQFQPTIVNALAALP